MAKTPTPVSPFSTGGGGVHFELLVAVHYLIALMRQEAARGVDSGVVQEVRLQQRNRDCPVDDVVVLFRSSAETLRLYLQVKHEIAFGKNDLFADVVKQAWQQVNTPGFEEGRDAVGLAIGEVCNNKTVKRDVADILDWARKSSTGRSFYSKVSKFKAKSKVLAAFEAAMESALGRSPSQNQVHKLLRHFIVIPFDFTPKTGRDSVAANNALILSLANSDTRNAASLGDILYRMAADFALSAGDITRDTLSKRVSARASFSVPVLQRAGQAIADVLLHRLENRLAAEKNSKKYIPDVFVEIGDAKDLARLFCHPTLFLKKLVEDVRRLDVFDLNRHLAMAGLPKLSVDVPDPNGFDAINDDCAAIHIALEELTTSLLDMQLETRNELIQCVPPDKTHIFREIAWRIDGTARILIDSDISSLNKRLDLATGRVMAIVARAGQGKTNFVCDLAEHCLVPRHIPCAYFTGKELGSVGRRQLQGFVARSIYGEAYPGDLSDLLEDITSEAERRDTAAIILIDAINEHPDLPVFAQELVEFIERCLDYPRLRIILTCRSEFFDARFSDLVASSFADRLVIEREIHQRMTGERRRRMIDGYLRFFKLDIPWMSDHVHEQLGEDPFLLRMFCEAYGDPNADSPRTIGRFHTIRRDAIFREYFKQKMKTLTARADRRTGFLVGKGHPYQQVIKKAISWMIDNEMYADVPVSVFRDDLGTVSDIVDEDVLVRRDLAAHSVLGSNEVLNFTFDACRDFLLSDYLLNVLAKKDWPHFKTLVSDLTKPEHTVAEGLREYLFFASRYLDDSAITAILTKQPWYEDVYIDFVFDLDDDAITEQDETQLTSFCSSGHRAAPQIVVDLMIRYDSARHPRANILTLFECLDTLDEAGFSTICKSAFGARTYGMGGGSYSIERLTRDLRKLLLTTDTDWSSAYGELAKLLLYLWNVPGPNYGYPARELFREFEQVHSRIASRLKGEHIARSRKGYQEQHTARPAKEYL